MTTAIRTIDLEERIGKLLPSQRAFLFAPERFSMCSGGFASGKSYALCLKGLILSAAIPGNAGYFLCYRGTDVEKRLMPLFFDEVCPRSWIKSYYKKNRTVVLRNNSVISFEHLHDAGTGSGAKTRRLGANLGWFGLDQAEETQPEHWDAMVSRLRLPRAPKKFGFGTMNPAGQDWLYERFFLGFRPWPKDVDGKVLPLNGKFYQEIRRRDTLGIAVNSEENRISNGGFVEDAFYDSLLNTYGEAWVARFVHCSFNNFKGKLFPDYEAGLVDAATASVHNIDPFPIPRHWELINGIDPGGDSPWAVVPNYADEHGNLIVAPGFDRRTGRVLDVANWMKNNLPWNESRTTNVIDWENKVVMTELADHGIHCQVANKEVNPGLLRMEGYFHVQRNRSLPQWYQDTQPLETFHRFRPFGSPRIFVFKSAIQWRKEHDTAKWDPDKPDQMWKSNTARFDQVDAERYVIMHRPEPSRIALDNSKYETMERADPMAAREWKAFDKRLSQIQDRMRGGKKGLLQSVEEEEDGGLESDDLAKVEGEEEF